MGYLTLDIRKRFLCLHLAFISSLVFKYSSGLACRIINFSVLQSMQHLVTGLYDFANFLILKSMVNCLPPSFRSQTCPDSLVAFLLDRCLKSDLWLPCLSLKVVEHASIYFLLRFTSLLLGFTSLPHIHIFMILTYLKKN